MSLAVKHFDPVLGVDVHLIQPPAPGPPVPVPHPFVGVIFDPFDYLPILGSTVFVNGLPAAVAGTGAQPGPHIPIGGIFVPPLPGNEGEMFMGSSTVLFDGFPASYGGLPVLSCQSFGMVAPFRPGSKRKKPRSLVLPTSVVFPVPVGAPVLIGGAPTISLLALGMRVAFQGLVKGLKKLRAMQKSSARGQRLSKRLQAKADRVFHRASDQARNRIRRSKCTVTGHPVDVATGKVFTECTDFRLPGPIPFEWTRVWFSTSGTTGPLGNGWHHSYDLAVVDGGDFVAVRLSDGRAIGFQALPPGEIDVHEEEGCLLERTEDDIFILTADEGQVHRFERLAPDKGWYALTAVEDSFGNRISLSYDKRGHLSRIVDAAGRVLQVVADGGGRIQELRAPHPTQAGSEVTVVSYRYDQLGNLVTAGLPHYSTLHYAYEGRLLVKETDPEGLSFHFSYDGSAPTARCVRTWGDDGILERSLRYDSAARRTWIEDSRGHQVSYAWTGDGAQAFAAPKDSRLEASGGPGSPGGESGGTPEDLVDLSGLILDSRGLLSWYVDPTDGIVELHYDSQGNIESVEQDGRMWSFRHDGWGREVWRRNPDASEVRSVYDLAGRLKERELGGFAFVWGWDHNDRIASIKGPGTLVAGVRYKGLDWEEGYLLPDGSTFWTLRDGEGDIVSLVNENGEYAHLQRHPNGELKGTKDFDGSEYRITSLSAGRVQRVVQPDGTECRITFTASGQIESREGSDGEWEAFRYDDRGRLVQASNGHTEHRIEYGKGHRALIATGPSVQGGEQVWGFQYDERGRLVGRMSPVGREIRFDWGEDGLVREIILADGATISVERDRDGREARRRFPNGLIWEVRHDAAGNRVEEVLSDEHASVLRKRTRAYDRAGNLREVEDRDSGTWKYDYDARDRLTREQWPHGPVREMEYDPSGNLLVHPDMGQMEYGPGDRLMRAGESLYAYDGAGRVEGFTTSAGTRERLKYDSFGRLRAWESSSGERALYSYDPFGRRIEKRMAGGELHHFAYDGAGLSLEASGGSETEYVTLPGLGEVLAMIRDGDAYFVLSDPLGAPRDVMSDKGEMAWHGVYDGMGVFRIDGSLDFPLRLPGQYYDRESGLHYNLFRYFDPRVGRFLARDPIRIVGRSNAYALGPSLLNYVDVSGWVAEKKGGIFSSAYWRNAPYRVQGVLAAASAGIWMTAVNPLIGVDMTPPNVSAEAQIREVKPPGPKMPPGQGSAARQIEDDSRRKLGDPDEWDDWIAPNRTLEEHSDRWRKNIEDFRADCNKNKAALKKEVGRAKTKAEKKAALDRFMEKQKRARERLSARQKKEMGRLKDARAVEWAIKKEIAAARSAQQQKAISEQVVRKQKLLTAEQPARLGLGDKPGRVRTPVEAQRKLPTCLK